MQLKYFFKTETLAGTVFHPFTAIFFKKTIFRRGYFSGRSGIILKINNFKNQQNEKAPVRSRFRRPGCMW